MIIFRADANEYIASGHVMRCLSIADALFSLGEEVAFITSDENATEMIRKRGHKAICLNTDWNDKEGELGRIIPELDRLHPDLLIVDSYQVTHKYLETLRKHVKLAYIDDLNAFDHPVDIVINYSIYAHDMEYPENKTYLLGTKYTPLRKQFDIPEHLLAESIENRMNCKIKQILITTGASDPYHLTEKIIEVIINEQDLNDYKLSVVKGRFCDAHALTRLADQNQNRVRVLENVENMAELMLESNMAVSAGGSTLYELCACCIPTVTFSYANNQLGNVEGFSKRAIMKYAGDVRENDDISTIIVRNLLEYHRNDSERNEVINKMILLACGKGAANLAEQLLSFLK